MRFAGKQARIIAEIALAQVGKQLRPLVGGQQQVGQTVAVVIGPDRGPAAGDARQIDLGVGVAAVLEQQHPAGPDQAQVRLAVAIEVHNRHRLGLGIDAVQPGEVGEPWHSTQSADIFAAETDEVALRVVVLEFQTAPETLDLGPLHVQIVFVSIDHARGDDLLAGHHVADQRDEFFGFPGVAA